MSGNGDGKRQFSRRKTVVFSLLIGLAYALFAEGAARVVFAGLAGSALPLLYGLDRDIRLAEQSSLARPVFYRDCLGCDAAAAGAGMDAGHGAGDRPLVYAFGGSTTYGRDCSSAASSWPAELAALRPDLEIVNHALNGTNSDFAIGALQRALADRVPDVVFWANWINELDVIFDGPRRNRDRLPGRLRGLVETRAGDFAANRTKKVLASLGRSLRETSALYLLGAVAHRRLAGPPALPEGVALNDAEIELVVANALLNLDDAERLGRRHGFRLVIVRLPMSWRRFDDRFRPDYAAFVRRWDTALEAAVRLFAAERGLAMLDVHGRVAAEDGVEDAFCDPVHMKRAGHARTARAVAEMAARARIF